MSNEHSPRPGLGNQFYEEAADWFTKMRGPHADDHQADFEAWLKRGALHRAAYNRIAEIFLDSDGITRSASDSARTSQSGAAARVLGAVAVVAIFAIATSVWFVVTLGGSEGSKPLPASHTSLASSATSLSTAVGEIRSFTLADGSRVTLDTDSLLTTVYSAHDRRLRLLRGRARFDVAHEPRPFRVAAGLGVITAHGTIFDVRLGAGSAVSVQLLRGAVEVSTNSVPGAGSRKARSLHLKPGERTSYTDRFASARPEPSTSDQLWPSARAEFQDVPLAEVIAQANRYFLVPIELEGVGLDKLRVTGLFSLRDSRQLAGKLAHLFRLRVRYEAHRTVIIGNAVGEAE